MDIETMKVEIEAEACCICNTISEDLYTPEEYDNSAPPSQAPLRSMLMHINNNKVVPSGRLCSSCISKTLESYNFSSMLASKGPPPLSEKIRALRKRLYELSQKIDVFIVVGGGGAGAGGAYSSEDIILVEKDALAAAGAGADLAATTDSRGLPGYQCSVCPAFFQLGSEYRVHMSSHSADSAHCCWSCGAQFPDTSSLHEHTRAAHQRDTLLCHLCNVELASESELQRHWCGRGCPACGFTAPSRAALVSHAREHPCLCAACFLQLPSPAARAAHALLHTRARRYVCATDACILRFNNRSELLSHIRKCHGEAPPAPPPDPLPCASCDRTFATAAALKRHARTHDQEEKQEHKQEWKAGVVETEEYLELDTLDDIEELS